MLLTEEGKIKAQQDWESTAQKMREAEAKCGWCKRARARGRVACNPHREKSRLAFVTSPVSEAYWAS